MPHNTHRIVEKAIFLLVDSNYLRNTESSSCAQQNQSFLKTMFESLHERILAYQNAGFVCSIRFLLVDSFGPINAIHLNLADLSLLKTKNRSLQPSNGDLQLQFYQQLTEWLLSKNITTVTVSHLFIPAMDCVTDKMIREVLPSQPNELLCVTYTWIYIQLMWRFTMETRAKSTFINLDVLVFFKEQTDVNRLNLFFNQFLFLLPEHTRLILPHHEPITGRGQFIVTNIPQTLPIFISGFIAEKQQIDSRASMKTFLINILEKESVKHIADSKWIKKLDQNAIPTIKSSRQVISDLVTKLSAAKNMSPLKEDNLTTKKDLTTYTINHSEWVFFSTHTGELDRKHDDRHLLHHISNISTDGISLSPSQDNDDDVFNTPSTHTNSCGLDILKNQLNHSSSKKIGCGSFGEVFETRWFSQSSPHPLISAVKKESFITLTEMKKALNRQEQETLLEHQLTMRCTHPAIVSYIASGTDNCDAYLIMEHGGTLTLRDFLQKPRTYLSQPLVLHLFVQICLAIDYLHTHQILHRDLKSRNILVDHDWNITLIDLGCAIENKHQTQLTLPFTNDAVGTHYYIAPEVCLNQSYGSKADIWSIGILLYEMITLVRPFIGNDPEEIMDAICTQPIPMNPLNKAHTSNELRQLIEKMLDKNPDTRIASIRDIFLQCPLARQGLTTFYNRFESKSPTQIVNSESDQKKYLFSIGMYREQCNSIFKACQSYDQEIEKNNTDYHEPYFTAY